MIFLLNVVLYYPTTLSISQSIIVHSLGRLEASVALGKKGKGDPANKESRQFEFCE